jgi:hypothetical protein
MIVFGTGCEIAGTHSSVIVEKKKQGLKIIPQRLKYLTKHKFLNIGVFISKQIEVSVDNRV